MKIISGGQTGVDRAALDAALSLGLPIGGWCPRGRLAADGRVPDHYPLQETESIDYLQRSERNVEDADATLILIRGQPTAGTRQTIEFTHAHGKPCLVVDLAKKVDHRGLKIWLKAFEVAVLNVAGPREGKMPGIHQQALEYLLAAL